MFLEPIHHCYSASFLKRISGCATSESGPAIERSASPFYCIIKRAQTTIHLGQQTHTKKNDRCGGRETRLDDLHRAQLGETMLLQRRRQWRQLNEEPGRFSAPQRDDWGRSLAKEGAGIDRTTGSSLFSAPLACVCSLSCSLHSVCVGRSRGSKTSSRKEKKNGSTVFRCVEAIR